YGQSWNQSIPDSSGYTEVFRSGVPASIVESAGPILTKTILKADFAWYAQDQWTLNRLTLNMGLRFDYLNAYDPAQTQYGGPLSQTRSFAEVDCLPCWKDINPRVGVAYDVFGNGRTAIKGHIGRYVVAETNQQSDLYDPAITAVNTVTRSWKDTNGDFIPQCDMLNPLANGECGPMSDAAFGKSKITTTPDPATLNGWGARGYNWQTGVSIEQLIGSSVAVTAGFYRTWYGNFGLGAGPSPTQIIHNTYLTPASFDPYCVTAPIDTRLPGGGGNLICGLYDLNPSKVGLVNNIVTFASKYGKMTEIYNGVDLNARVRLPHGGIVQGGMNWGNSISTTVGLGVTQSAVNMCFVVDNPQQLRFCDVEPPYQPRLKVFGSYPLLAGFQVAANFQSLPGAPIAATWNAPNSVIAPSLGRNLSGGAASAAIQLIAPDTIFERRIIQLDLRLSKSVRVAGLRLQGMFDCYNVLNANPVTQMNTTYGPQWLTPTQILDARLFKFGVQMDF
ncbi:MAG TPA: TonB-dependent receptor, partial [Vicinamibacterales bacterium]|nr:TonB-dependent receptor [Vicinamibacterales bacterium]